MKPNPTALMRAAFAGAVSFVLLASAFATDYYATPAGAGAQNGSSWADAYPQSQIQTAVNNLAPGDTLNLGSGTYTLAGLTITGSGTEGNPKTIRGVDTGSGRPLFQGNFDVSNDAGGARFIYVPGAAHYWTFKNLAFKDHPWVFSLALVSSGDDTLRSHFVFEDLSFDTIEDAIRLYNINNVQVTNCTAIRYTKKAFRFGDHTSFVTFTNCFADCTGGDPSWVAKAIPVGFGGDDTAHAPIIHDITLIDCVARNHGYPQGSSNYWQGDGFSSERGTYNLTFIRCKAYDNRDGGFDNKASNILYQDCVSVGNSRGFRHWADAGQMINCVAAYNFKWGGTGSSYGIWLSGNGGELTVDLSTFHESATALYAEAGGILIANNSLLSTTSATAGFTFGPVTLNNCETWRPGAGTDPAYVAADSAWRGDPLDAMDSQTYGTTKGYHSSRVDEEPNLPPTVGVAASPTEGIAPLTVTFAASAEDTDGFIVSYLWTFGDGQTSTEKNPTVVYGSPGTFTATCTVTDNRGAKDSDSVVITASVPTTPVEMRIESGSTSSFTDSASHVWSADYGYGSGGGIVDRGAIEIAGTNDDRLYQTERWGVSSYALLVANGTYEVRLHFAETYTGITAAGQRVFSVTAEGAAPAGWTSLDVFAEAGGRDTALVKPGLITVTDNVLNLAFTASANSAMINAIEIIPSAGGDMPPAAPTGLATSDVTTSSFTLSWSPATDDVGVVGYEVFRNGTFVGSTTGTSLAITGLAPYTSYNMTVRARDTAGNGSVLSAPLVAKTLNDGTVGNDVIIDNTALFGVTLTGTWLESTYSPGFYGSSYLHDNNGGKGTKSVLFTPDFPEAGTYTIYMYWSAEDNRASNVPVDITHAGGTSTVTVNQRLNGGAWFSLGTYALAAGTANNVLIRTTGTNGFVIADAVRFLRQGQDGAAPSTPAGLTASAVTSTSFTLSWTASTDDIGVTGYEVFLDGVSYATPSGTSVGVSGLSPNTTYSLTVRARDAAGNWSAQSAALDVTTTAPADTSAPTTPTDLAASNVASSSFTLSWTASTDNVGVTGYEVFRDGVSVATPAGTSATLSGLTPETTYSVTVRARDAAGNWSPQSTTLSVTTTAGSSGGTGAAISVNLTDGAANSLAPTDVVGAVPVANWTNSTTSNQALTNVVDSTGAATTADITFGSTGFGYSNNTPALPEPMTDDAKMMRSQRALSNSASMSMVAAQVPYATYDVYVYWGGRVASETVPLTMTVNFQLWNGTSWVTSATGYIRDTNRVWDGTYDESTATTATAAVDGQEYVVFRNVSATTFRLAVTSGNRTGICGVQIVEHGATSGPEAPTITSASSATGTYGEPFAYEITASENPTSFGASGLPAGLVLDVATGVISGTPTTTGSFTVELSATNAGGIGTASLALEIAQASQAITIANPGPKTYGDAPFALTASASSGLPVAYAVTSGPAELSGATVTLNGAGTVSITATQAGDANILPATPVEVSFVVAPASAELALGSLWQLYDGQPKPVAVATDPESVDVEVTYNGSTTPPVYPGSYDVAVTVSDPDYTGSTSDTLIIATTALVRHAPAINGSIDGSVHVLLPESFALNTVTSVSGDLLVPGTPNVKLNGQPVFAGTLEGPGNASPDTYTVTLNSGADLRHVVRRIDAVTMLAVAAPPAPAGARDVMLNSASDSAGDFATLRNLTLNSGAGERAVPAGTYGWFTVNTSTSLVLGVPGSTEPAVYNLQGLTLNGGQVQIVGPVVLTLASGSSLNGFVGSAASPESLLLRIASGDLTLNTGAALHGFVEAPAGTVTINTGATLTGGTTSDRLVVNGGTLTSAAP